MLLSPGGRCRQAIGVLLRPLTAADAEALVAFVAMATSAPGREQPPEELATQAHQWLEGWNGRELGIGCEDDGQLVGAAWARVVDRVLARDPDTGAPLPELIIAVAEHWRGAGLGGQLIDALMQRAHTEGIAGLVLTVSERNPVAVRLYEQVGFRHAGHTPTGLRTMIWSTRHNPRTH